MATVAIDGKTLLVEGVSGVSGGVGVLGIQMKCWYKVGTGGSLVALTEQVLYGTATESGGESYVNISVDVPFTIPTDGIVELVEVIGNSVLLASETVSSSFPDGGDFVVTSFEIRVA